MKLTAARQLTPNVPIRQQLGTSGAAYAVLCAAPPPREVILTPHPPPGLCSPAHFNHHTQNMEILIGITRELDARGLLAHPVVFLEPSLGQDQAAKLGEVVKRMGGQVADTPGACVSVRARRRQWWSRLPLAWPVVRARAPAEPHACAYKPFFWRGLHGRQSSCSRTGPLSLQGCAPVAPMLSGGGDACRGSCVTVLRPRTGPPPLWVHA